MYGEIYRKSDFKSKKSLLKITLNTDFETIWFYCENDELPVLVKNLKKRGYFKNYNVFENIEYNDKNSSIELTEIIPYKQKKGKFENIKFMNFLACNVEADVIWAVDSKRGIYIKIYKPFFRSVGIFLGEEGSRKLFSQMLTVKIPYDNIFEVIREQDLNVKNSIITNLKMSNTNVTTNVYLMSKTFNSIDELNEDYEICDGKCISFVWEYNFSNTLEKQEQVHKPLHEEAILNNSDTHMVKLETVGKKHVIIIDCVPDDLRKISDFLRKDYKVTPMNSLKSALDFIDIIELDLILISCDMFDDEALSFREEINKKERASKIPVCLLSNGLDNRSNYNHLRGYGCISKELEKDEFLDKIKTFF